MVRADAVDGHNAMTESLGGSRGGGVGVVEGVEGGGGRRRGCEVERGGVERIVTVQT